MIWLIIWQMTAICVHNRILLVGPVEVFLCLVSLMKTMSFYQICAMSLLRILVGFLLAFFVGVLFGGLSYFISWFDAFLTPLLSVMKSIPVASFVVLLLIWQGASNLAIWIAFFVVFPNTCVATKRGLLAVDEKLLEMAKVQKLSLAKKLLFIYKPTLIPFLISSLEVSIGMSFKSGVAAEVIGAPDYSIGERIYVSKVYLDTASLLAWTIALIVISFLVEKIILCFVKKLRKPYSFKWVKNKIEHMDENDSKHMLTEKKATNEATGTIQISNLNKSFGENVILSNFSAKLEKGKIYVFMKPSGYGKTTLFRLLAGLEKKDDVYNQTDIAEKIPVDYMFQENRLLEEESTILNILLPKLGIHRKGSEKSIEFDQMCKIIYESDLLPKDSLFQIVETLSGGMKRRASLMRTMLNMKKDSLCLLDEPFSGMDEETKKRAADFIKDNQNGCTIILATHNEADVELLGGQLWKPELR